MQHHTFHTHELALHLDVVCIRTGKWGDEDDETDFCPENRWHCHIDTCKNGCIQNIHLLRHWYWLYFTCLLVSVHRFSCLGWVVLGVSSDFSICATSPKSFTLYSAIYWQTLPVVLQIYFWRSFWVMQEIITPYTKFTRPTSAVSAHKPSH